MSGPLARPLGVGMGRALKISYPTDDGDVNNMRGGGGGVEKNNDMQAKHCSTSTHVLAGARAGVRMDGGQGLGLGLPRRVRLPRHLWNFFRAMVSEPFINESTSQPFWRNKARMIVIGGCSKTKAALTSDSDFAWE